MAMRTSRSPALRLSVVILLGVSASVFSDAPAESTGEAERHFERANELLKRMDYEGAIAEYEKVVSLSSDSKITQDAHYWIGQSQFKAGRYDAAQATFAKLIEQYPTSAIVPVTKLMVERVEQAKKNEERRRAMDNTAEEGSIVDPYTGVRYTKTGAFAGKNDVISLRYNTSLKLSPNGKFLLRDRLVIPMDGRDPFDLVDAPAYRGTWSPDGTKVAFYSGDAICVVSVSAETARPMGPARELLKGNYQWQPNVSWSSDGKQLAFTRVDNEFSGDVWTLSVEDGSLVQVTSDSTAIEHSPAWSPSGKWIAYVKGDRGMFLAPAGGGAPRKIAEPEEKCSPSWSPDGKWLLCICRSSTKVYVHALDNERSLEIVPPGEAGQFFGWSTDGKKMLFYCPSYDYQSTLRVVSASGGPSVELGRHVVLWAYGQRWSSDSRTIVVEGQNQRGEPALWIVPLSGTEPIALTIDFHADGTPIPYSLSPQWNKVVFGVRNSDGTEDYWVAPVSWEEARTTGPATIVFKGRQRGLGGIYARSWSPDGSKIAMSHKGDVWIAKSAGGAPVQITKTSEAEGWPTWSTDGKEVYYVVQSDKEKTVYAIPASGGEPGKVLDNFYDADWHPGGRGFAVASKDGHIKVVPRVGDKMRVIADLKDIGLSDVHDICFSGDGEHVACIGRQLDKSYSGPIVTINVDDGNVIKLATEDKGYKYWLSWSPDSKWISYNSDGNVKVRPEGTLWEADFDQIVSKASDSAAAK